MNSKHNTRTHVGLSNENKNNKKCTIIGYNNHIHGHMLSQLNSTACPCSTILYSTVKGEAAQRKARPLFY